MKKFLFWFLFTILVLLYVSAVYSYAPDANQWIKSGLQEYQHQYFVVAVRFSTCLALVVIGLLMLLWIGKNIDDWTREWSMDDYVWWYFTLSEKDKEEFRQLYPGEYKSILDYQNNNEVK